MPELPDVEGFRRVLDSCARGRRIDAVDVHDTGVLHGISAARLRRDCVGHRFTGPERHGKWLLARTDGPALALHFGMTGRLLCCGPDEERHPHDRVAFTLTGRHQLRYRDQRKLKGIWPADDPDVVRALDAQGPDALTARRADLDTALAGRRGGLKSALTNQNRLAGLGNLLADEILWRARLNPALPVSALTDADRRRLYTALRATLRAAVPEGQVPPRRSWLTGHRDESGARCPRCGTPLCRGRTAGRGTVWCPHCQPDPDAS